MARDIFVLLCDGVLSSSRSVIAFASAADERTELRSSCSCETGFRIFGGD